MIHIIRQIWFKYFLSTSQVIVEKKQYQNSDYDNITQF